MRTPDRHRTALRHVWTILDAFRVSVALDNDDFVKEIAQHPRGTHSRKTIADHYRLRFRHVAF
jgi:hypothetical protein